MSNSAEQRPAALRDRAPPPVVWRSWPLRENWRQTAALAAGLAVIVLLVYAVSGQELTALLITTALVLATWRLWLPATYEIDARGIHQRFWRRRRIPWHAVARCKIYDDGFLVLRDSDSTRWDALRGLFIPWHSHATEVLAALEYYLDGRRVRTVSDQTRRPPSGFDFAVGPESEASPAGTDQPPP
jgi:hypothetical protein